uniref:Uncharacterized protein n=1 Tax=Fagus sylvatica TaxID=28930 RepID=A0A2N9HCG2_FAGSY
MALMMISVAAKGGGGGGHGGGGHGGSGHGGGGEGHGGGGAADGAGSHQDGNGAITKGRIIPAAHGNARPHNSNASNLSDSWFSSIMCLSLSFFLLYVSSSSCS